MALSKREKYIAGAVGATVVLVGIYQGVVQPYFDRLDAIAKELGDAHTRQADVAVLFDRRHRLTGVWSDLQKGGLNEDASEAEDKTLQNILDWAQNAGVNLTALKPERTTTENQFQVISFHVTGTGSTPQIARLMQAFETASEPVRVNEMQLTPRKEGTDDLMIQLSVSTLCLKPAPEPTANASNNAVSSAGQSQEVRTWNE